LLSNEFFPLRIHQIDVSWGFAPDLTGGAYSAPSLLAGFKRAATRQKRNGREGREGE